MEPARILGPIIDDLVFELPQVYPAPKQYTPQRVSASGIRRCSREWFYVLRQLPGKPVRRDSWDIAAAQGTIIHEQIQAGLLAYDLIERPEAYLQGQDRFLSGRIDGILVGRPTLLEIKTSGYSAWRTFPNNQKFLGYQDQIQVYLALLGLPEALLVCVRREPIVEGKTQTARASLCKEFIIPADKQRGEELIAKAGRIRAALDADEVPVAEPGDGCFFCAHQARCYAQDVWQSVPLPVLKQLPEEERGG